MAFQYSQYLPNLYYNSISLATNLSTISIHKGPQPSASEVIQQGVNIHLATTGTYLMAFTSVAPTEIDENKFLANSISAVAPSGSEGTATWAMVWNGATLPSSFSASTEFIIVPVSSITGSGVVKLNDINIVSGNTYTINDFSLSVTI